MASRPNRVRKNLTTEIVGGPQFILAHIIVTAENILRNFAWPLMLIGFFLTTAWLGLFAALYPWAHLIALVIFTIFFFHALGRAKSHWKPVPVSLAKRRIEEASGLKHRPLDVIEDRPVTLDGEQLLVWQEHVARAQQQVKKLHWPKWKLSFSEEDPYALRYGLLILLVIAFVSGWGALGGRLIASINPALGKLHLLSPTLDAWITPPEYTHLPPIMIATPAGMRYSGDVIEIPEGSTITAHIAEKSSDTPDLVVNGETVAFATDDNHDFGVDQSIRSGDTITIRRGWQELGSWNIHVVADKPPQIALTEAPVISERKAIRLSYEAKDDYGVTSIAARILPRESLPGVSNDPIDIELATPDAKEVKRASFEDLTSHPWAGLPVQIQLIATDAVGHKSESEPVDFTLPERIFIQPVARALIEERKKILRYPEDDSVRNETANVMAGVAHEPSNYRGDPVVLMALRSGAVRLVLDHSHETIIPVTNLLWQVAVRIEDGSIGLTEQNLRQVQKELADALDRNASEQEVQQLINRLHQALKQYLSELSTRMATRPGPTEDMSQMLGAQTNLLTPQDLDKMLDNMRNLSATGSRDAARNELEKMQQLLESINTQRPQFTEEQKQDMRRLAALRELTHQQQELLDKTFQSQQSSDNASDHKLSIEQTALLQKLQELMGGLKAKEAQSLDKGAQNMKQAKGDLLQNATQAAIGHQTEAIKDLQQAMQSMTDNLRSSMMMLPMPGLGMAGGRYDPFGRNFGSMLRDDGGIKVPDHMEVRHVREILDELQRRAGDMSRPKTERDYIERLLQNF